MNRYKIAYKGLESGSYSFDFKVDNAFFKEFEMIAASASEEQESSDLILGGACDVTVDLMRSETFLRCGVSIIGSVEVECDRCLEPCSVAVDFEDEFTVKFSDSPELSGEWDGEVMWLPTGEGELDIAQYIYESIILDLPYQRVHEQGECNPEMISRFKEISAEEFDKMEQQSEEESAKGLSAEALQKLQEIKDSL